MVPFSVTSSGASYVDFRLAPLLSAVIRVTALKVEPDGIAAPETLSRYCSWPVVGLLPYNEPPYHASTLPVFGSTATRPVFRFDSFG